MSPFTLSILCSMTLLLIGLPACQKSDSITEPPSLIASSTVTGLEEVVYHINYDDSGKQAAALHSMQHHIDAKGKENLDIRVVLHGKGLSLLLEKDTVVDSTIMHSNASQMVQATISHLKEQGIRFKICKESLKNSQISYQQDLYDVAETDLVDNGISEIIRLQTLGFMYLKL